ncbi:MAG TPA: MFS transporter [Gammaproteobacteria bacterium]
MLPAGSSLYWRLSVYYISYFASVGVVMVFWGPYLQFRGFDAVAIGQLLGILAATKIVAPYVWGWLADRSGQRMRMIRYAACAAAAIFMGVFFITGFGWMAVLMLLFSFFWNAGLPQFDAATLNLLGEQHHRYSIIRSTGSMGFIVSVLAVGLLLDIWGLQWLPLIVFLLLGIAGLCSFAVPNINYAEDYSKVDRSIWPVLQRPEVCLILLAGFLMQLSAGPYYTFFSIHLQSYGYQESMIGLLWITGTSAEVLMFYCMHRILPAYSMKTLLLLCFLLAGIRWLMIAYAADMTAVLVLAQLLHAFTFGMFHAVMIHLIHHMFTGVHQGRGQGLYSSVSFGIGTASGALLSGYMWSAYGAEISFTLAAGVTLIGALLLAFGPPIQLSAARR